MGGTARSSSGASARSPTSRHREVAAGPAGRRPRRPASAAGRAHPGAAPQLRLRALGADRPAQGRPGGTRAEAGAERLRRGRRCRAEAAAEAEAPQSRHAAGRGPRGEAEPKPPRQKRRRRGRTEPESRRRRGRRRAPSRRARPGTPTGIRPRHDRQRTPSEARNDDNGRHPHQGPDPRRHPELSVLELSELLKEFEERFGVTAAAPVAVAAAAPAGGGAEAGGAEEEKTSSTSSSPRPETRRSRSSRKSVP